MLTAIELTPDSAAYNAGILAYWDDDFVPCPYEPGSRLAQLWFSGRDDAEHAARVADVTEINEVE